MENSKDDELAKKIKVEEERYNDNKKLKLKWRVPYSVKQKTNIFQSSAKWLCSILFIACLGVGKFYLGYIEGGKDNEIDVDVKEKNKYINDLIKGKATYSLVKDNSFGADLKYPDSQLTRGTILEQSYKKEKYKIIATLSGHIDALNRKDIKASFDFFYPDRKPDKKAIEEWENLFRDYDIKISVDVLEVEFDYSNETGCAKVRFEQKTEKLGGPAYRDNIIEGVHSFKKINGVWKIFDTEMKNIKYIN